MGLAPASVLHLTFVALFLFGFAHALDGMQIGTVSAGIDIRTPLDAFQCDPWLIYYNIAPTDQGRSLGIDYDNISVHLRTPDSAQREIVKIDLPRGEGIVSWRMILRHNTQFFVSWGPHDLGDHVQVKLGGGGDACLTLPTRTLANAGVTVDPNVFQSVQTQSFDITSRPHIERVTSPEAGLQTRFPAAGVIVTPTTQAVPSTSPPASALAPTSTRSSSTSPPKSSDSDSASSSDEQETASSQSGQTSGSLTSAPTPGSTEANFAPTPTSSGSPADVENGKTDDQDESLAQPVNSDAANAQSTSKTPIIVGAAVGGTLFLLAVACCLILALRRRRNRYNTGASPFMLMVESGTDQVATTATTANSMAPMIDVESTRTTFSPPVGKGPTAPGSRRSRFFATESAPTESEYSTSHRTSDSVPMDLARALAVVAAHVRSGEGVQDDPTGAPPEYSRTIMSTSSGATAVAAAPLPRRIGRAKSRLPSDA